LYIEVPDLLSNRYRIEAHFNVIRGTKRSKEHSGGESWAKFNTAY
jgi:hypothetical protein